MANNQNHPILAVIETIFDITFKIIWVFCELLFAMVKPYMK